MVDQFGEASLLQRHLLERLATRFDLRQPLGIQDFFDRRAFLDVPELAHRVLQTAGQLLANLRFDVGGCRDVVLDPL